MPMDFGLQNKVVVISGSAGKKGSIGQTLVRKLAQEGAYVVMLDIDTRGKEYEKELKDGGMAVSFYQVDLTDPVAVQKTIAKVAKYYDGIDVLINNLGINDGVDLDAPYINFLQSLKLNLGSFFILTQACLPHLKTSKGNILNISSKVALTGQGGTSGYAAAKGGVLGLTREWAVDLINFGIRVNAILPAECWTPGYDDWLQTMENPKAVKEKIEKKIPLFNRMTTPDEIGNTALFLISELASHTTGQFLFVDGGYVHLDRALLSNNQ